MNINSSWLIREDKDCLKRKNNRLQVSQSLQLKRTHEVCYSIARGGLMLTAVVDDAMLLGVARRVAMQMLQSSS